MSLKRRLLKNVGVSTLGKFSGSISSIAGVPIFLSILGIQKYSIWLIISAVPVWLSMADVGFGAVASNEMSLRVSRGDWPGAERVFQSAWASILCVSSVGMMLTAILGFLCPWSKWLAITAMPPRMLAGTIVVLCFSSIIALQGSLFAGLYRAKGRAEVPLALAGAKPMLDTTLIATCLYLTHSLFGAAIALLLSQIVFVAGGLAYGLRICPEVTLGVSKCSRADILYCLHKGVAFCVFPLGNALILQGATLIINYVLGAASVVVFNTCRTMMRSAQQMLNLIGQSTWPEFSHLIGGNDLRRARRLHHITLATNLTAACTISLILMIAGPTVYGVWTRHHLQIDRPLLATFVVGIVSNSLWFGASIVVSASNRHVRYAVAYIVGAVLSLPVCFIMAHLFGLKGAALATLTLDVVIAPILFRETMNVIHETPASLVIGPYGVMREVLGRMAVPFRRA